MSARRATFGKENSKAGDGLRKAKAAPDFSKLHKQWDEKLQKGKAVKKKPLTSVQPFQLSQASNHGNIQNTDLNFKCDPKAKESILNCKGISENIGRATTIAVGRNGSKSSIPRFSKPPPRLTDISQKVAPTAPLKSGIPASNVQKPGIPSPSPAVQKKTGIKAPDAIKAPISTKQAVKEPILPLRSPFVKKTQSKIDFNIEFKCDDAALDSIINGEGISVLSTTPSRTSAKFGPSRRKSQFKDRGAPFPKAAAAPRIRFSDRGFFVKSNLDESNAAKKRWSIYNRESFSTKTDLMTWLKKLAEEPNTTSESAQSKRSSFYGTSTANTSDHPASKVTNSNKPIDFTSSRLSLSAASSPGGPFSILKPTGILNSDTKQTSDPKAELQGRRQSLYTSMESVEKPGHFKFNQSCVGYQGFVTSPKSTQLPPQRAKTPVSKPGKKISALCSIEEIFTEPVVEEQSVLVNGVKGKTPVRSTPSRNLACIKEIPSAAKPARNSFYANNKLDTPRRDQNKSVPKKTMIMPLRSASKNKNLRPIINEPEPESHTVTLPTHDQEVIQGEGSSSDKVSGDSSTVVVSEVVEDEERDHVTSSSIQSSRPSPIIVESPDNTNKKKVRWNSELTFMSPDELDKPKDSCVIKLSFEESEPVNEATGTSCKPESPIPSKSLPIIPNVVEPSISIGQTLPAVPFNNIVFGKGTTLDGLLPTKSVTSHQIKYVIPAEQPLEKSVPESNVSTRNTGEVTAPCNNQSQTWSQVLGQRDYTALSTHTDLTSRYMVDNSYLHHVTTQSHPTVIGPRSSTQTQSFFKKDKTKKKKRISILEKIYGDSIMFVDDMPQEEEPHQAEECTSEPIITNEPNFPWDVFPKKSLLDNIVETCLSDPRSPLLLNAKRDSQRMKAEFPTHVKPVKSDECSMDMNKSSFVRVASLLQTRKNEFITLPVSEGILSRPESPLPRQELGDKVTDEMLSCNLHTPQNERFSQSNTSTFVTYSSNTKNISYGDFNAVTNTETSSPKIPCTPETLSPSCKKDGTNTEFIGGVTIITPGKKERRADYNAFIVSPARMGKSLTASCRRSPGSIKSSPLIASSMNRTVNATPSPQSSCRSDKLGKYVTSLLNNTQKSFRPKDNKEKVKISENRIPLTRIPDGIPKGPIRGTLPPRPFLDDTCATEEPDSILNESEICMVFSTPFKQGLRNHMLLNNSLSNNDSHYHSGQWESANCWPTPSKNIASLSSNISAFRRVPAPSSIQPKLASPVAAVVKSDELQSLSTCSISPGRFMRAEDSEMALYNQLGDISSQLHEEVNLLRKGGKNPLSIILTSGDEMHFVPIDVDLLDQSGLSVAN